MNCHCGKELHYTDPRAQEVVQDMVDRLGEFMFVKISNGRTFKVQRHYIALHGIKEQELAGLGFEEVK